MAVPQIGMQTIHLRKTENSTFGFSKIFGLIWRKPNVLPKVIFLAEGCRRLPKPIPKPNVRSDSNSNILLRTSNWFTLSIEQPSRRSGIQLLWNCGSLVDRRGFMFRHVLAGCVSIADLVSTAKSDLLYKSE